MPKTPRLFCSLPCQKHSPEMRKRKEAWSCPKKKENNPSIESDEENHATSYYEKQFRNFLVKSWSNFHLNLGSEMGLLIHSVREGGQPLMIGRLSRLTKAMPCGFDRESWSAMMAGKVDTRRRYSTRARQLKAVKTKKMLSMMKEAHLSIRDRPFRKAKTHDMLSTKIFMSASRR